jgi:hypothetical protein
MILESGAIFHSWLKQLLFAFCGGLLSRTDL